MVTTMTIQPAAKDDLPAIAALYLHNHREAYRGLLSEDYLSGLTAETCTEKWAAALSCPREQLWVAREGDALLGFAAGLPDEELPQTWYLESLHVAEDARGRGVGTALIRDAAEEEAATFEGLREAARRAGEAGFTQMSVCIVRGNERAGTLYRKLGAAHRKYFEDAFGTERFASEKLLWETLPE